MQQPEAYHPFQVPASRGGELALPIRTSSISRPRQGHGRPSEVDISKREKPLERGYLVVGSHSQSRRTSKPGFKGLFTRTSSSKVAVPQDRVETSQYQRVICQRVVSMDAVISSNTEADDSYMEDSATNTFPAIPKAPFQHQAWIAHHEEPLPESAARWVPPSICQAYSQAVKSATLLAPELSAATTIGHDALRKPHSKGSRHKWNASNSEFVDSSESSGRIHKKYKKRASEYSSMQDWMRKIYMLTNSGYLLQYAGEGGSNRLPEKTMQLWKDSVAFASDAIPGKHWVIQISQTSEIEDKIFTDIPRSIFGKLGPRERVEATPNSLLLVLNSPEEMDSWLSAIRNEIQALGTPVFQPELQCYDPITGDLQGLPKTPSGRYQTEKNAEEVNSAIARVSPSTSSAAKVAKDGCRTVRMEDSRTAEYGRIPSSASRQSMSFDTVSSPLRSMDTDVCGRARNSSTASNTSAGSMTLIPSAGSSTANLPGASSSTFPDASTLFGNNTSSSVLDTRTTEQSLMQAFSTSQRRSEVGPARPHRQSRLSQEPSSSGDRSSAAPVCWISGGRKPFASAMLPPPLLPPTPPASATDSGRSFLIRTPTKKENSSNPTSPMVGGLQVSTGQPYLDETSTCSCHSPKLHGAKGCLPNQPASNPPLSPYALTSFDLYGLSHTRPPSNPVKPELTIPRRTSSLLHSRVLLSRPPKKSLSSPLPSAPQASSAVARSAQPPCQEPQPTSGSLPQASSAILPHPVSMDSDKVVPRRYSSIADPRGFSQQHPSYQTESPVPASANGRRAQPLRKRNVQQQHDRQWFTSAHAEENQESSHLANSQANTDSIYDFHREISRFPSSPHTSLQDKSAVSYPQISQQQRRINNRRSTSQVPSLPFLGPPIYPPPSSPLPSIPSVGLS
ncbi:MAG: hypothetical protein FRX48_07611 [Lasallia pustulata]|uniref:PH domain-containing protein n=1 Tax=Lasallia pustulata TaxID=136370 RepID=A0A5M8PGL2_9LECA|nr:MAG: hypothetical protein FRX48_07611 [Lasallia pustulata]